LGKLFDPIPSFSLSPSPFLPLLKKGTQNRYSAELAEEQYYDVIIVMTNFSY